MEGVEKPHNGQTQGDYKQQSMMLAVGLHHFQLGA
jgi:hypothetical protein